MNAILLLTSATSLQQQIFSWRRRRCCATCGKDKVGPVRDDGQGRDVEMLWWVSCAGIVGRSTHGRMWDQDTMDWSTHVRPWDGPHMVTCGQDSGARTHTGRVHVLPLPGSWLLTWLVSLTVRVTMTNVTHSRALRAQSTHATHAITDPHKWTRPVQAGFYGTASLSEYLNESSDSLSTFPRGKDFVSKKREKSWFLVIVTWDISAHTECLV